MPPAPRIKFRSVFVSKPKKWRFFDLGNTIFEAKASVLTSGSYFQLDLIIETQFRNFQIYFRHIVFDEVPGKILEALLVIREGYTRCPAHQWMRVEKLVSMLLVSARDLNPQIKIFKTYSGPWSFGGFWVGENSSCCNKRQISCCKGRHVSFCNRRRVSCCN